MKSISPEKERIRASIVDGIFYPSEKLELLATIRGLLEKSEVPPGMANVIISPHAAYQYSGHLAAAAFKAAAARKIDLVVLLGPVHREVPQAVLLPESPIFETPLGQVAVHQETIEELETCSTKIIRDDIAHLEEHCLEVQLPFIQHLFPRASIVPILMGAQNLQITTLLSKALRATFADKLDSTLFVISANMASDMFNKMNDSDPAPLIDRIKQQDWRGIINGVRKGHFSSCGAGCIATILSLQDIIGKNVEVLKQGNSAQISGDKKDLVHYAAIAIKKEDEGCHEFHANGQ
ncbi:hypothetical protein ES703_22882 [subsurface metagenome]